MQYLTVFGATLLVFVGLDVSWIVLVANAFFNSQLGALLRSQPDLAVSAVFYLIYAAGLVYLAVMPAAHKLSAKGAAGRGAAVGLTAYATFDLTNLAIIQGWTLAVSLVDISWGTLASALASFAGCQVARRSADLERPRPRTTAIRSGT